MRKRGIARAIACAALAASMALPAPALAVNDDWVYAGKADPCAGVKVGGQPSDDAGSSQTPPDGSGWLDEGTETRRVAQQIFDRLTGVYGWSGAAAAGVISNVKAESGLQPDKAEGVYNGGFGMDSDALPAGAAAGCGGGLFQETPYTVYTTSAFWRAGGKPGWDVDNQVDFIIDYRFKNPESGLFSAVGWANSYYTGDPIAFATIDDWLSTSSAADSANAFAKLYLRPAAWAYAGSEATRVGEASYANSVLNASNIPADRAKIDSWLNTAQGGPTVDGSTTASKDKEHDECLESKAGGKGVEAVINRAKSIAADKSVGYSQINRLLNPDIDCSSFVWHSYVQSGAVDARDLGGSAFSTADEPDVLKAAGFTEMDYDPASLESGDILWRDGHTSIYIEEDGPDGTKVPLEIGANGPENGNYTGATQPGDQLQAADGDWHGGEVGAKALSGSYAKAYRPPADLGDGVLDDGVMGEAGTRIVAAAKSVGSPGAGLCAKWVSQVYAAAGYGYVSGDACDQYARWCSSADLSTLKPGMIVAVPSHPHTPAGAVYGHVAIYVGNGMVMDNIGYIRTTSLDHWISYYGTNGGGRGTHEARWGWAAPNLS